MRETTVAEPVRGRGEPVALVSVEGRVPVEGIKPEDIEPTLEHWGRYLVRRLDQRVRDQGRRTVRIRPLSVPGEGVARPDKLGRELDDWLAEALLESRWFDFVEPAPLGSAATVQVDGELLGGVSVRGDHIQVSVRVLDNQRRRVTAASVELPRALLGEALLGAVVIHDCGECPEMVVIPAGHYEMGSRDSEAEEAEGPLHRVTITQPFAVGVYEVTFDEWDACNRTGGCSHKAPDSHGWGRGRHPVINVSWDDAQEYLRWLSSRTGKRYRLLSEAEWEYVARAGTTTRFWWGDDVGPNRANCKGCGSGWNMQAAPVGSFPANAFGLHEVHGNVLEWVEDCWHESYGGAPEDGSPWVGATDCERVVRGGSWYNEPRHLRSAYRGGNPPALRNEGLGFRVARALTP